MVTAPAVEVVPSAGLCASLFGGLEARLRWIQRLHPKTLRVRAEAFSESTILPSMQTIAATLTVATMGLAYAGYRRAIPPIGTAPRNLMLRYCPPRSE